MTINTINRNGDGLEVVFTPRRFFGTSVGTLRNTLLNATANISAVDSCNTVLMSGRRYALVYSAYGDPKFTFCDRRRVKSVYRALKQAKKASRTEAPTIQASDAPMNQTATDSGITQA